jgi:hypothetical protein
MAASVPRLVRNSPVMRKGGFQLLEERLGSDTLQRMRSEALRLLATADRADVSHGGIARRWLRSFGEKAQLSFYHGRRTLALLEDVIGAAVVPTGRDGSYLYYTRPGDHFAIHRDPNTKHHVLLITCVADTADSGDGGMFCVYPSRIGEKIWTIRATPGRGVVKFRLRPGQSLVLFGRWVPHAVLPIGENQTRIVSVLCYKFASRGNEVGSSNGQVADTPSQRKG